MADRTQTSARLDVDEATLSLVGDINFHTVAQLRDEGRRAIGVLGKRACVLDLSAVTKTDSAGLALVVDWVRTARLAGSQLQITGVSPQLADIARVSGLEEFLAGA